MMWSDFRHHEPLWQSPAAREAARCPELQRYRLYADTELAFLRRERIALDRLVKMMRDETPKVRGASA